MKLLIDIPDTDIPKTQDMLEIDIMFIDGHISQCTYPFEVLQEKTGHWITGRSIYFDVEVYRCSECKSWFAYKAEKCPNCHVRMVGEKE